MEADKTTATAPILVTGAPRSGTTFLGEMLALPHHLAYIFEPFNFEIGLVGLNRAFAYIDETIPSDMAHYDALVAELLVGRARFRINPWRDPNPGPAKRLGRRFFTSRAQLRYRVDTHNRLKTRWLIKDPMASFAAEYLHRRHGMDTVVIMRHPAATVASYKRLGWRYNLRELTDQAPLMDRYLGPVLGGVNISALSAAQEWSYLWLAAYTVLDAFLARNPAMLLVRHEDLSLEPVREFERLYKALGLPFTDKVRRRIVRDTQDGRNPVDPGTRAHVLRRNAALDLERWRTILTPAETSEVERLTRPFAQKYYPEGFWW